MKFIVLKERSEGNETIGTAWIETFTFDGSATLEEVVSVVANARFTNPVNEADERDKRNATKYGKLILSIAENEK